MSAASPVIIEPVPAARRSVFGNYQSAGPGRSTPAPAPASPAPGSVESALARSFIHQFLARAFDYPRAATWLWLCRPEVKETMRAGARAAGVGVECLVALDGLVAALRSEAFEAFHDDYITAIGHAARGSCPVNEIEYGELKADPLFQPHRLADLAAFYRAFGMELGPLADERHDHISVELEFMGVLAAQEALFRQSGAAPEALAVCQDAQRKFLREHLGRWTPAFARRLYGALAEGAFRRLALFTLAFIESECRRWGVAPGCEDLLLRPADDGAAMCEGCGIKALPPGAMMGA